MITRRDFLVGSAAVAVTRLIPLRPHVAKRPLKMAVITDVHHGLAPDSLARLKAFVDAVELRPDIDLVLQLGDFCHPEPESRDFLAQWRRIKQPKIHVLGNHDMDKGDKALAMKNWGMPSRYGSVVHGGYRFVTLDLNHFKKDGQLVSYSNGNYFTDNATHNWADPEQLDWLAKELRDSKEPVVLLSHQPLGFAEPGQTIPPEQLEVLNIVKQSDSVLVSMFGHLHVDRLENYQGLPCYCVNSASYFWYEGMQAYTKPLFAFMELSPRGTLAVEGIRGEFKKDPPSASSTVLGRSASIGNRTILTSKS